MLIHHFLENSAARYPDKIAVIHDDERVTYRHLNKQTDYLAGHLLASGIARGDRVALLLENGVDYISAYYAILKIGAVAAPLNPGLKPDGLRELLDHSEPAAILANHKCERLLKACRLDSLPIKLLAIGAPRQQWRDTPYTVRTLQDCLTTPPSEDAGLIEAGDAATPSDLASIIYTSGSTGKPKGVMLSHGNVVANTNAICQYLHISPADIQMIVLPFSYVMGKSLLNTHVAAGATVIINNGFMYPADVVHQMIEAKVTSFSGVPSTYAYLLNRSPLARSRERLAALRYCSQAGGHMPRATKLALREALPAHTRIVIMYGATEAAARLTYLPPEDFDDKIDSIGKPIPGVTVRVMDDQYRQVPDGSEGILVADGPNIMMGYWKDPEDTQRVLSRHGYHTGDIGYRDREGFFFVTGRKDSLLKVGGHRVNPLEIEDFLIATDRLVETAVVGLPDNLMGNRLVALVVSKENPFSISTLRAQCVRGLPSHKCPALILPVRALPKKASGKIDRQECTRMAEEASDTSPSPYRSLS